MSTKHDGGSLLRQADGDGASDSSPAPVTTAWRPVRSNKSRVPLVQQFLLGVGAFHTETIVAPASSIVNNEGKRERRPA